MQEIDKNIPFTVETDASDFAISATLNQDGRSVAFHSRTVQVSQQHHSSAEKKSQAIVESIHHWKHFFLGRHFTLITDRRSVTYMYDYKASSKIKNNKIRRWRVSLSPYSYDFHYRTGNCNHAPDTFTRVRCATISSKLLYSIHSALCHPGVTRLHHFIRSRNFPYSIKNVRKICNECSICQQLKSQYYCPDNVQLIKATQPLECISIDFKDPLPSRKNPFFLTILDEYFRFPFTFPVKNFATSTVIKCLGNLFSIFEMPGYVNSDRGPSFISDELKTWLFSKGIANSRTTPYNPTDNSQVERYNCTAWKSVLLALRSRNIPTTEWERVLPDALHSIRSLFCTATNCTPHERMFNFHRRCATGQSIPSWLRHPGKVLMRRNVRNSKYDPLMDKLDVLEANPQHAHMKLAEGWETTISFKRLGPAEINKNTNIFNNIDHAADVENVPQATEDATTTQNVEDEGESASQRAGQETSPTVENVQPLRRSERTHRAPDRLDLQILYNSGKHCVIEHCVIHTSS